MAKSIYVHIPFCNNICAYCDFTKFIYHHKYVEPYINQLVNHINSHSLINAETIYIGGGTPTSLPLALIERVLIALKPFSNETKEYTIETNVENINQDLIDLLKKYKINRISIGVQSFNDIHLKAINRKHCYKDILEKINLLISNNFENISIDLIYGLPNQTIEEWIDDINKALSLPIKHISLYSLMIEEHTVLYLQKIKEREEEFLDECYQKANEILKKKGFYRYEVSNYALSPKYESKHNLVYWNDLEYIAFGVGASGYENNIRYTYTKSLQQYINDFTNREEEIIDLYNHKEEYIMLHLRTKYGISIEKYNKEFNSDFRKEFEKVISNLLKEKMIEEINEDTIKVCDDKIYILNQIIIKFLESL